MKKKNRLIFPHLWQDDYLASTSVKYAIDSQSWATWCQEVQLEQQFFLLPIADGSLQQLPIIFVISEPH